MSIYISCEKGLENYKKDIIENIKEKLIDLDENECLVKKVQEGNIGYIRLILGLFIAKDGIIENIIFNKNKNVRSTVIHCHFNA